MIQVWLLAGAQWTEVEAITRMLNLKRTERIVEGIAILKSEHRNIMEARQDD